MLHPGGEQRPELRLESRRHCTVVTITCVSATESVVSSVVVYKKDHFPHSTSLSLSKVCWDQAGTCTWVSTLVSERRSSRSCTCTCSDLRPPSSELAPTALLRGRSPSVGSLKPYMRKFNPAGLSPPITLLRFIMAWVSFGHVRCTLYIVNCIMYLSCTRFDQNSHIAYAFADHSM